MQSSNFSTILTCAILSFFSIFVPKKLCMFPPTTYRSPKCFFNSFIKSDITSGFLCDNLLFSTPRNVTLFALYHLVWKTPITRINSNLNPLLLYIKYYNTIMQTQCNHNSPCALIYTKHFSHFHSSHAAHTLGWIDTLCQNNIPWYPLRSSYPLAYPNAGMLLGRQKWPRHVLHMHQQWVWKI